ncbi:MAG: hypothetical protein MJZ57_09120 [Bacteroidales bacterium]|nr:hypothetical protein [Bacteroidales bacterium]
MRQIRQLFILILLSMTAVISYANNDSTNGYEVNNIIAAIQAKSTMPAALVERGVKQVAALWTTEDGTQQEFERFCYDNFCKTLEEKTVLFNRICDNFETIFGHDNRVAIELQRPEQVVGYPSTSVDQLFSAYNGLAHFQEDMYASKLAFVVILNFPHFTLKEKQQNGSRWSDLEWGFVRLGDVFTSRVLASVELNLSNVMAAANNYIDNYNVDMQQVGSYYNEFYWENSLPLITHWGLRDEIKAAYADKEKGLHKQMVIYDVMKRIIQGEVPTVVTRHNWDYKWYPSTNQIMMNGIEILTDGLEKKSRYQYLLDFFHAEKAADEYCQGNSTFIDRKFEDEYEISVEEAETLFKEVLASPQVKQVADLISKRMGRKLQPFDIWYDGFKERSNVDQSKLDELVKQKYPTKDAFAKDLPNILTKLGFTKEMASFICSHVSVDASVGAGHAWESKMKCDNSMLRTRVGEDGMDYKGYNIGVHEFGHNVEQTISLHYVPNYFLTGVPNTAFTEALAFVFQGKDLQLLGLDTADKTLSEDLNAVDLFWQCYEIMGVSMVDIQVWKWMYANPNADAAQLKEAVLAIAKDVWNQYYAPVFKMKDETILAVYSHMIIDPLYLSAYPIGHLIDFQLETYLKDKNMGEEVTRIYKLGRLIPDLWMERAMGQKLSTQPLLERTSMAVKNLSKKK